MLQGGVWTAVFLNGSGEEVPGVGCEILEGRFRAGTVNHNIWRREEGKERREKDKARESERGREEGREEKKGWEEVFGQTSDVLGKPALLEAAVFGQGEAGKWDRWWWSPCQRPQFDTLPGKWRIHAVTTWEAVERFYTSCGSLEQ